MSSDLRVEWQTFPKSCPPPAIVYSVADVFSQYYSEITSDKHKHVSDGVLKIVRGRLEELGFEVESGKQKDQKVIRPVLFGPEGRPIKTFEADAYHAATGLVLEVEAGRGVTNYQFLKDLFQACMMQDAVHLAIALRRNYRDSNDYAKAISFFETLYASARLQLPLSSVTIIGY